jgi:uncharacterized membrane protein YqjE
LRVLVSADLSLARSALGRALAFTGVAVAFGASAWMLLMAAVTAVLHDALGWSWTLSLAVCAAPSLVITALGMWRAMHYFEHTRMQATRRQLARLGIGELAASCPMRIRPNPPGTPPKRVAGRDQRQAGEEGTGHRRHAALRVRTTAVPPSPSTSSHAWAFKQLLTKVQQAEAALEARERRVGAEWQR